MNDLDIERLAKHAGRDAARRIDADRVVERVLGRLRESGREPIVARSRPLRWLQIAAAVVVLVAGGVVMRAGLTTSESEVGFPVPLAWEELNAAEWDEVLDSLSYHAPMDTYVTTTTLYDLTEDQLRELLNQMES
jgi:hypothetical protein